MSITLDLAKVLVPALLAISAFCYYLAHLVEKGASNKSKVILKDAFKNRKMIVVIRQAFKFFATASDIYFGQKLISSKAILRSLLMSCFWSILILIVCVLFIPSYRAWLNPNFLGFIVFKNTLLLMAVAFFIDYVSVCITRKLIRESIGKERGKSGMLLFLIIDFVASVSVFYILFNFAKVVATPNGQFNGFLQSVDIWTKLTQLPVEIKFLEPLKNDMLVPNGKGEFTIQGSLLTEVVYAFPESILFYSSMLTSAWLWLYVLAYLVFYLVVRLDRLGVASKKYLDVENNPAYSWALAIFIVSVTVVFLLLGLSALSELLSVTTHQSI